MYLCAKFGYDMSKGGWLIAIYVFKMAVAAILDFVGSEIWPQGKSRLYGIYLRSPYQFGEDISKGGRVMAIYVFPKWRPAAILDSDNRFLGPPTMANWWS